jgi:hypothetical protein
MKSCRSLHYPALNWKFGLTVRSPLKGLKISNPPPLQSPERGLCTVSPDFNPGRDSALDRATLGGILSSTSLGF